KFFKISNFSALPTPSYFHLELSFHLSNIHPTFNYSQRILIFFLTLILSEKIKGQFQCFQFFQIFQYLKTNYFHMLTDGNFKPTL
ncbi:hypothetical protein LDENG_00078920, partial [Lucifuga dentata]